MLVKKSALWCLVASFSLLFWLDASAIAQTLHPALESSTLTYLGKPMLGIDASGNGYVQFQPPNQNSVPPLKMLQKIRPDGTIVSSVLNPLSILQMAFDTAGNSYAMGQCQTNCSAPNATFGSTTTGVLFGKLNAAGDGFVWLDQFGGVSGFEQAMRVDTAGNVYLFGVADCSLQTTPGSFQPTCATGNGNFPAFVAKIDPTGTHLIYCTFLRGTVNNQETITGFDVDAQGNAFVTGSAREDWPTTQGVLEPTSTTNQNERSYIAKLSADGSQLLYSTFLNEGTTTGLVVDAQGNAYIVGKTFSTTFPTTASAVEPAPAVTSVSLLNWFGFAAKLNASGSALLYSTYIGIIQLSSFGTSGPPAGALDAQGNLYVVGQTYRAAAPTVNAIQQDFSGPQKFGSGGDGAIAVLNPQGSAYLFTSYLGGVDLDEITSLRIASDGLLYVAGDTVGIQFPAQHSLTIFGFQGDGFFASIRPQGTSAVPILMLEDVSLLDINHGAVPQQFAFGSVNAGVSGQGGRVFLGNYGAVPLNLQSITTTGDYSQTNDCGATVSPGARCTVTITFSPTAVGTRNGTLVVNSNVSPITAQLSGTGQGALIGAAPLQLSFGALAVGSTSASQSITITDLGNTPLSILGLTAQGDFAQTNNCGTALAPSSATACTIQVTFTPIVAGPRTGSITITSNAFGSATLVVPLSGGVNPDFSFAAQSGGSTTATINAGGTATYNLSVAAAGGFSGSVSLSCSGAPTGATCSVTPSSLNLSGASPASVTVSVQTTARSSSVPVVTASLANRAPRGWMLVMFVTPGALVWMSRRKPQSRVRRRTAYLAIMLLLALMTGCVGGGNSGGSQVTHVSGTPAGTYTLSVVASSGTTSHPQNLTLVVQ